MRIGDPQLSMTQDTQGNKEKLPGNVVIVERLEASYRIVYGKHNKEQKVSDIGNPNLVILEVSLGQKGSSVHFHEDEGVMQYTQILATLKEKQKPFYIVDIPFEEARISLEMLLKFIEPVAGAIILLSLSPSDKKFFNKEKMTRREFLQSAGKLLAGGYLLSEAPLAFTDTSRNSVKNFLQELNENIHPESNSIILTFRNCLVAQKAIFLGKFLKESGILHPEISMVYGNGHSGLEKTLNQDEQERLNMIKSLLDRRGMEEIRRNVSNIARVDFNDKLNEWQITNVSKSPDLTALELDK